jgi:hypothetical protein
LWHVVEKFPEQNWCTCLFHQGGGKTWYQTATGHHR